MFSHSCLPESLGIQWLSEWFCNPSTSCEASYISSLAIASASRKHNIPVPSSWPVVKCLAYWLWFAEDVPFILWLSGLWYSSEERGKKLSSINIIFYSSGTLLPSTCYINNLRGNLRVN